MRVVVIGASAGGVEALQRLVGALPPDLAHALFVVLHGPPSGSNLPSILERRTTLPCLFARDGDAIRGGRISVGPPDRHLLVRRGHAGVLVGPKEHGFRPAVDPLFRSAAHAYGRDVVGVVLSGTRDDGAAGLVRIKRDGGTTACQSPEDALYDSMPRHAIDADTPDFVGTPEEIAAFLAGLPPHGDSERECTFEETEMADQSELDPGETTAETWQQATEERAS